jgi:hypothetical protein
MKNSIRNRILALGLLLSFAIPFAVNSLHFVIFQHHHSHHNELIGTSFKNNEETHQKCLWDYAIEEVLDNSIVINSNIESSFQYIEPISPKVVITESYFFSLRAPPAV